MRVADIWEKQYPLVVRLIKDMLGGGAAGPYLPLAGGTMTGQIALSGDARVVRRITVPVSAFLGATFYDDATGRGYGLTCVMHKGPNTSYGTYDFQLPADWDSSTDLTLIVRWMCGENYATNNGRVRWIFYATDLALGVLLGTGADVVLYPEQNIPTLSTALTETSFAIDYTAIEAGNIIRMRLELTDPETSVYPTAEVEIVNVELEYTANALGEAV
jgi:hypothetical protein